MSMECENCGAEIEGRPCQACGETCPNWAKFCPHCGARQERPKSSGGGRRLCSDESCIGIIGENGHCSECGRAL